MTISSILASTKAYGCYDEYLRSNHDVNVFLMLLLLLLTHRAYHMGWTEDLRFLLQTLRDRHPQAPFYLSGFSLGGNVICKYLGKQFVYCSTKVAS